MENFRENRDQPRFPEMKILQFTQTNFATVGISRALATQSYPLNGRLLIGFLALIAALIFSLSYASREAESLFEYTQAAYMISLVNLILFDLLVIILKANALFDFIEDFERLANTSKYEI